MKKKIVLIATLCCLLLNGNLCCGQIFEFIKEEGDTLYEIAPRLGPGSIHGVVTDSITGKPVAATIDVYYDNNPQSYVREKSNKKDGKFALNDLKLGKCVIYFGADRYDSFNKELDITESPIELNVQLSPDFIYLSNDTKWDADTIFLPPKVESAVDPKTLWDKGIQFQAQLDRMIDRHHLNYEGKKDKIQERRMKEWNQSDVNSHFAIPNSLCLRDASEVLKKSLDELSLKKGYRLGLSPSFVSGMTYFFVYKKSNKFGGSQYWQDSSLYMDKWMMDQMTVSCTPMAAWQIFLLLRSYTMMPCNWHSCYGVRQYIYCADDLSGIMVDEGVSFDPKFRVLPEGPLNKVRPFSDPDNIDALQPAIVEIVPNVYEVRCCYWNDWTGLVQDRMQIEFDGKGNLVACKDLKPIMLFPYLCGRVY